MAHDEEIEHLEDRIDELKGILQAICVKCRSNPWGSETPRKAILDNIHDIASYALAGRYRPRLRAGGN